MLLTVEQLKKIQKIIERHHAAVIANTISPEALAKEVMDDLEAHGLIHPQLSSVKDAYLYGQILAATKQPHVAAMSFPEFQRYIAKNPVPLTPIEQHAIQMAQTQAAQYVKGLGNTVNLETGQTIIEADAALRNKMKHEIRTAVAENIERRESLQKLRSTLGWATDDWARDWDRIARTEKQNAMQQGVADSFAKQFGGEARVAKMPMPDACPHCLRLHLGPDGAPRIFPLSYLERNGTNVGRKAADWLPVVGVVHPHCLCQLIHVPEGWGFDEQGSLVPGGKGGIEYKDENEFALSFQKENDLLKALQGEDYVEFQGLPIVLENRAGTQRQWKDAEGNYGVTDMLYAYGFIKRTTGADEDELDVYLGPDPMAREAYIVTQQNPATGLYDEEKVMLGFSNALDAQRAYQAHYNRPDFQAMISAVPMELFDRWVRSAQVQQAEIPEDERFVIPLQKGIYENIAINGGEDSRADYRNPGPGTVSNYVFQGPARVSPPTLLGPDFNPMVRELLDPEVARVPMLFDQENYTMVEPLRPATHPIVLPEGYWGYDMLETGLAETNRAWLDRHALDVKGDPNLAVPRQGVAEGTDGLPEDEDEKELSKAAKGEMAASHKYIKREWMKDHWLYWYMKEHEGMVDHSHPDPKKVWLSVPKEHGAVISKIKANHGLTGAIEPVGDRIRMEIGAGEAMKMKLHSPVSGMAHTDKPGILAIQAKDIKRLGPIEVLKAEQLTPPHVMPGHMQRGQMCNVQIDGKSHSGKPLDGVNRYGQPIFIHDGKRRVVQWADVQPVGEVVYTPTYAHLTPGNIIKATPRQGRLAREILDFVAVAGHKVAEYVGWMKDKGVEAYYVGGIVRDLVHGTSPISTGREKEDTDVLEDMKDVDLVTTATPNVLKQMLHKVAPEIPMMKDTSQWGVVRTSDSVGVGLDLATLASGGTFHPEQYLPDENETAVPSIFDHDLLADAGRRDFTCNCLYYDAVNNAILDPTGMGYADAQNHVLRLAASEENQKLNYSLPIRFWKFRLRGYKPEVETLKRIKEIAAHTFQNTGETQRALAAFNHKIKNPVKALTMLREAMVQDGAGDLYDQWIKPNEAMYKKYMKDKMVQQ